MRCGSYNIECPFALSDDAPIPCFGSQEQCDAYRKKKKGFLICPVRGHDAGETKDIVEELESSGWQIHWPHRDTNQIDSVGLRICEDNKRAIQDSDRIFIVWDGKSKGSLFDLGMAFALDKPIRIISLPRGTFGKSFQNMIRAWEKLYK